MTLLPLDNFSFYQKKESVWHAPVTSYYLILPGRQPMQHCVMLLQTYVIKLTYYVDRNILWRQPRELKQIAIVIAMSIVIKDDQIRAAVPHA